MTRPREELLREIESVKRNIRHAEKDLQNPAYTAEQKEDLRKNIAFYKEQLAELQRQLG